MQRAAVLLMLLIIAALLRYNAVLRAERDLFEARLWIEFAAGLSGVERMLQLALASQDAPAAPLLAAYEHSLTVRRLSPVVAGLLHDSSRGEPFAGYVLSLMGGVASLCEETRRHGQLDVVWLAEVRGRIASLRDAVQAETWLEHKGKQLLQYLDSLFADAAGYTVSGTDDRSVCAFASAPMANQW